MKYSVFDEVHEKRIQKSADEFANQFQNEEPLDSFLLRMSEPEAAERLTTNKCKIIASPDRIMRHREEVLNIEKRKNEADSIFDIMKD